jgi:hypothetical protein
MECRDDEAEEQSYSKSDLRLIIEDCILIGVSDIMRLFHIKT